MCQYISIDKVPSRVFFVFLRSIIHLKYISHFIIINNNRSFDQTLCQDSVYGFTLAAVVFQCITLLGMLVISFRSSIYVIEKNPDTISPNKKHRYRICCCCSTKQKSFPDQNHDEQIPSQDGIEVIFFDSRTHRSHKTDDSNFCVL